MHFFVGFIILDGVNNEGAFDHGIHKAQEADDDDAGMERSFLVCQSWLIRVIHLSHCDIFQVRVESKEYDDLNGGHDG